MGCQSNRDIYYTHAEAYRAVQQMIVKNKDVKQPYDGWYRVYACPFCRHWHFGVGVYDSWSTPRMVGTTSKHNTVRFRVRPK